MQLKLFILRKSKKLTQKRVASYLGIAVQTYRNKENGIQQFSQDEMFALSTLFNLSMEDIFLPRKHQNGDKIKIS